MLLISRSLFLAAFAFVKRRHQLAVEILALRQQVGALKRSVKRCDERHHVGLPLPLHDPELTSLAAGFV